MHEKGLKLIEASKYVKENNLYNPKEKKGGTLLTLKDANFVGDAMGAQPIESGGVKPLKGLMKALDLGKDHVKRSDVIKKIMNEKGLKLIEASKFVKEHNLYTPKEKKVKEKKGGTLLTLKDADFVGDVLGAQPIESGNVKPLKGRGKAKAKKDK